MENALEVKFLFAGRNASTPLTTSSQDSFQGFLRKLNRVATQNETGDIWLLVSDMDRKALRLQKALGIPPARSILIRNEPAVVCPGNYSTRLLKKFGYVLDFGRNFSTTFASFHWPQTWVDPLDAKAQKIERIVDRLVMINANKMSVISGELYSLRRRAAHVMPIDIYGPGWQSSTLRRTKILLGEMKIAIFAGHFPAVAALRYWFHKHPGQMGAAADKLATLSQYRAALVVENSADYMSEKLFDCLLARCIPIYVGPNPSLFGVPEDLVVHSQANLSGLLDAFQRAKQIDYEAWLASTNRYLNQFETQSAWSAVSVYSKVLSKLDEIVSGV